ncbi:MAG: sigma-70 family RNA polymerase sigma factor [Rubripirellula sp.]|jgi:RNA polymerase primary sigma factor/RNA polymerase sigma factor|nr:sigma-70 family RNA polymerase sigma factor [Planctomycetaceae bacterium]MDF1840944.1 sigma-70 family RNA polymerase sigma factor [Rubripirellula sp.]
MHEEYRDSKIKELRCQLTRFAPKGKKVEQAALAENLYSEIEPDRSYAFDYLCFRITNYRPETPSRHNIASADLKHDLRLLIEDLSDSADVAVTEVSEPVHTVDELSKLFSVSTKTISRWRDAGLVSRRLLFAGRKRVGFLHSSVERFVSQNRDKIRRGERFSQLSEDEKSEMIERARQLVEGGASLSEITRQLAQQMKRSPETIRYTLKNFDADNKALAIFPDHRGVLTEEDKRAIFKLHVHGASVARLCKRFKRTRTSIQRILLDMRMEQILELPLDYIYNEDFEDTSREAEYLGPIPEPASAPRKVRVPAGLPSYLAALYDVPLLTREQEYHLFRKMNYLKHKASRLREGLEETSGSKTAMMDEIDDLYEAAVLVKNKVVQSNLRLVVSIAKRHVASTDDFFALVSDGNMSLIRAVEKFDYSRGNKFSTYASWAIMKNFARTIPSEFKHRDRFRTTTEELFVARQDDRLDPYVEETVQRSRQRELSKILNRLDEREQKIITARFGLGRGTEPLTLKQVGEEMGVTKERIRQLEARALTKLREAADEAKIDVELGS